MKIVAIKDCSDGNDSIGEMWKETAIFEDTDPVGEILKWAYKVGYERSWPTKYNLTITIPAGQEQKDEKEN